jgi:hypothetical protein
MYSYFSFNCFIFLVSVIDAIVFSIFDGMYWYIENFWKKV